MYDDENQMNTQVGDILKTQNSRVLNLNATEEIFKFSKDSSSGVAF